MTKKELLSKYPELIEEISGEVYSTHIQYGTNFNKTFKEYKEKILEKDWGIMMYGNPFNTINIYPNMILDNRMEVFKKSQNLTLKVGDKVKVNGTQCHLLNKIQTITGFLINKKGNLCVLTNLTNDNGLSIENDFTKVESLFKTEDGVDVFEGDNYWFIWVENPSNEQVLYYPYYTQKAEVLTEGSYWSKKANFFSTKEKAEEYVLMNKPTLSIRDLYKLDDKVYEDYIRISKEELKQFVKNKNNETKKI